MRSHAVSVQPGDVIAGKYLVERVLGEGGMGLVVAARHADLDRLFAIKLLLGDGAVDPDAVERFLREARAASQLVSHHVVRVSDTGRLDSGTPFMVLEYLEGRDLSDLLDERGPLPLAEVCDYVLQACEALAEAHGKGIVHRDIKPSNLFLTQGPDGVPLIKVLDFGISKLLTADAKQQALTNTGSVLGSPRYMSPEQLRSPRDVDTRSDIWALGVVLYELLTGVPPFVAENLAGLSLAIMTDEFTPASQVRPELPAALDLILARCLEKSKQARWGSIDELAVALEPFSQLRGPSRAERIQRIRHSDGSGAAGRVVTPGASAPVFGGDETEVGTAPVAAARTGSPTAPLDPPTTGRSSGPSLSPEVTTAPPASTSTSSILFAVGAGLLCVTVLGGLLLLRSPAPAAPAALVSAPGAPPSAAPPPPPPASAPPALTAPTPTAIPVPPPEPSAAPPPSALRPAGKAPAVLTAPVKPPVKPPVRGGDDGMDARK